MNNELVERNERFFFLGLVSLALSLFLFPLAIYLLPQVWFGWNYRIPSFILSLNAYLQDSYGMEDSVVSWLIFYVIFGLGVLFAVLAYFAVTHFRVDIRKPMAEESIEEVKQRLKYNRKHQQNTMLLIIKLILIFLLVFVIGQIMQWAISVSPG